MAEGTEEFDINKPRDLTDRAFRIGLVLKALDGLWQTVGGLLLLILQPQHIDRFARWLTQNELSHDPHDYIATHILKTADSITGAGLTFAAIYLLAHGIVKLILVVEVWRDHIWAYLGLIVVTGLFIVYQLYRLSDKFSLFMLWLTIFDLAIIYLTTKEYRRHKIRINST